MAKDLYYKGTRIGKGELHSLLEKNDLVSQKAAERLYYQLQADFRKTYPQCTPEWFKRMNSHDNN